MREIISRWRQIFSEQISRERTFAERSTVYKRQLKKNNESDDGNDDDFWEFQLLLGLHDLFFVVFWG